MMSDRTGSPMRVQTIRRPASGVPQYDSVEILMLVAGVVFIVAIAFVF